MLLSKFKIQTKKMSHWCAVLGQIKIN